MKGAEEREGWTIPIQEESEVSEALGSGRRSEQTANEP